MLTRRLLRLVAAILAGTSLWLAFPDHDLWWCAPIGVALLALAVVHCRLRAGVLLGFVAGMAFFVPTLSWSGTYVGVLPWFALAVLQSLYFAALGGVLAVLQRRRIAPFLGACAWMTQEWLRGTTPFGGFPWARLAFSQADAPWTPIVAWTGAPGLGFLIALLGGALAFAGACAWTALRARQAATGAASQLDATDPPEERTDHPGEGAHPVGRRSRASSRRPRSTPAQAPVLSAAAAVVLLGAGCLISPPTSGRTVRVAGVQGNVPTAGLEFNAQRRAVLDNHAHATEQLAADVTAGRRSQPDLVVWPENSSDIDPLRNADAGQQISDAVSAIKAPTLVGAVLDEPRTEVSNASMLYEPGKGVVDRYVKQHPVPFGEYIPYRSFFRMFSSKVDLVKADFAKGKKVSVFTIQTAHGPVHLAPIICFEVAYDDLLRKPAQRGADLFAVQTNNATFGHSAESTQQLAVSRIRALEYGRSIAHVSTVGVSALITPDGVTHEASSLFTRAVLDGDLPLRSHATLAQRLGRWPEIIGAAITALALLGARRRKSSASLAR